MYKVVILPLAKKDIQDAANWYQKKQIGLGKKFTIEVRGKGKNHCDICSAAHKSKSRYLENKIIFQNSFQENKSLF